MSYVIILITGFLFITGWSYHAGYHNGFGIHTTAFESPVHTVLFTNVYYLMSNPFLFLSANVFVLFGLICIFIPHYVSMLCYNEHRISRNRIVHFSIITTSALFVISVGFAASSHSYYAGEREATALMEYYRNLGSRQSNETTPRRRLSRVQIWPKDDYSDIPWGYMQSRGKREIYLISQGSVFTILLSVPHDEGASVLTVQLPSDVISSIVVRSGRINGS